MGQNVGAAMPLSGAGELGPYPTQCIVPKLRATSMPNFILIHSTILPQYTNATDRQDRTGQWSNSIGQTVLQMVNQK